MAENAWERYKREHGLDKQEQTKATETKSTENAWERFKREHGTMESNPNFRQDLYAENQKAKQQREQLSNLNARRRELESTAPTVTGNRDAEWADYYRNMLNYAAETGDRSLYYDNLSKYKAASEKVSGQYASQMARHNAQDAGIDKIFGLGDKLGFGNYNAKAKEQERRYDRDAGFYQQMGQDAQLMGNQDLYNKAVQGYGDSYSRYMRAYDMAYNADMQHLQENAPDLYIAHTATDEDVNAKLEELKQRREETKARAEALDKELNDLKMSGQITSIDSHGVASYGPKQREANAANAEVLALDKEIETYTKAARVQKNNRGAELYEQYLGGGKVLDPETFKKIDAGKARYEADRKAAIAKGDETLDYGLNFFAKARGVWHGDKDRLEEAGWDSTFDTAANLRSEDENTFYALYADDPQKAMDFITYANNRRNEEYEGWMAEWAHENGWNTAGAFFQALGNRIGSGVANLVDPNSAKANQLAQTSSGLLAGGSQLLNEWSGTIDTDIPIVRDLFNGKGLGDFYQLANSIVESGINAYAAGKLGEFIPGGGAEGVGALGVMLMGSSASAADYNESIKRGLTPGEAQKHALAAGINEALFEFVSLDKLVDTEKLLQAGTIGKKIKAIFIQSGVEASEEFCTTVANRLADAAQARRDGYDSQIENRAKELIALGMSRDEALETAEKEWMTELINDAIGGFISGGLHDAGALVATAPMRAVSYVRGERAANQAAGATSTNEQQAAMRAYAADNGIAWNSSENAATVQNTQTETEGTDSSPAAQNDNEGQQTQEQPMTRQEKRQERREEKAQAKSEREIGADVRRVQEHIDKQLAGKSVQEQTAIRDKLVQQYGKAIAPAVYSAIRTNAYQQAAQNANPTAIQAAKEAALEGVTDQEMRRAVSSAYDQAAVNLAIQTKNTDALGRYYQQIRGTGTGTMTMEAIVKGQDGQEARSAITGMSEDGKSVTLDDGSTVAVKELQADADTMDIIHEISALGLGKNTDKVFQAYKKSGKTGLDGYRWIMDYTTAIDQGRNRRISLQEAIKRSSLDAETVMEAYEMGHKETMDETRKAVQKNENRPKRKGVTGRVANIDTSAIQNEPMSKQEREQFDLANQIFELLGVDVKWESSKTRNGKYVGANGSYLGGVITLDIHAGRNDVIRDINSGILATTGHELTHFLQEYAPEQYQALKEFVLQQIVKNGKYGEATLERMIQDKQNRSSKKLTKSQAEDEVVADACQTMLRDSKALREFAEQKPEAAKGVIRWLADWFKKIKAAFSRSAQLSEQARFMEKLEKDVREAFGQLWDDALREAVKTHDEVGNIENAAIQEQNSDRDTEYLELAKDPEKNAARLQEMVDKAAIDAGYTIKAYHGRGEGFTVFDKGKIGSMFPAISTLGFYFTPFEEDARGYASNWGESGNVLSAYLKVKNPLVISDDGWGSAARQADIRRGDLARWAKQGKHDGIIVNSTDEEDTVYIVFESNQIKSADPVTYDDQGNVIPLSERFNPEQEDIRYSLRPANELYQTEFDFTEPMTTDEFTKKIAQENDSSRYFPKGLSDDFMKAITRKSVFTKTKLYRGIDASEFDFLSENGFIKSNSSYNFSNQKDQTLADEDARYALSYATGFAPREIADRHYKDGMPSYLIEFVNASDLNVKKNDVQESYTYGNIDQKYITRVFEIMYDPETKKDMIQDVTNDRYIRSQLPQLGSGLSDLAHGLPEFVRDRTTGTILYAVQGEDGWENGRYISEKFPDVVFSYDQFGKGLKKDAAQQFFGVSGNEADLEPMTVDKSGNLISKNGGQYSERDYDTTSDLELMEQAAEGLTETGSDAYWESLLQSAPDLAGDKAELAERARDYKAQAEKLERVTAELAEAKRNMTLTNRKLNTKGIFPMVQGIMKDMAAGDVKGLKINKNVEKILIDAYQKALDQIDEGSDAGTAWETVYNDGVVKAVDYMMENATVSEKIGYKWEVSTMEKRYGAEGRQYLLDLMTGKVAEDFAANRYRAAIQKTEADRLLERTEKQMQKKVDAQKTRVSELKAQNETLTDQKDRLENDVKIWRDSHRKASEQVTFLNEQLQETRKELRESNKLSAKERKAKHEQAQRLDAQVKAKRTEANAWKALAERNESLLRAALKSKNADLDALRVQMDKQATEAQKKQSALVQKLADQKQREADILAGKLKPLAMQRLLKAVREEAAEKATAHKEEVFQRYKERKQETAIRNKIKNLHTEMSRDLLKPREGHFVPQELIRPVVELLDMVNTQTNRAKSESAQAKIDAINAQYDKLKNDERYSQYYDDTVKALLVELSATLEGRSIYELNAAELSDVYTAMKAMRTTIRNAIKADLIEKGKETWEIGNEMRQELRNGKGASPYLLEKYHMAMLSSKRAFNRFGGYMPNSTWNKVYRMLNDAQLQMLNLEMLGTQIFDSVLKGKGELKQARALQSYDKKDLVDVGLKDADGNAVPITRGMMLALYMHLQNEENMRHVMYGGLTLPDFKRYYNGSEEAWGQKTVEIPALGARVSNLDELLETIGEDGVDQQYADLQAEIREMFESVRAAIEEKLTDYDRKWIAASKEFFDVFSRNVLNEVTNSMYGFSKAKVDNYFPIVTDPSFLKSDFETVSRNASLENAGFMKERVKASNPILLEDITKAVNRQISNVSRYAGLTEALKTFGRVYNVQTKGFTDSVKKAMAKTYGKNGQKYVENLIADMVGARSEPGTIFDRVKGKYAQAVLAANMIVTIKQAASYPTAAATIGWKPLAKALAKGGKNGLPISRADRDLIDTYSPLLWYRSKGSVDTEIGEMAHAQDWTKKAKWLMGWIQGADKATVGRLWYAAQYYVEDNFNLAKGTQEQIKNGQSPFYQKVAEVFADIVQDTQPNYTVLERPDILRSPNKLVRALVMFSTQRFQNANILIDAVGEYSAMMRYDKKNNTAESKAMRKAARRKLTRAISSQVVAAAVLEAMTLLGSLVLHRMNPWRDDDDEITQESILEEYLNGFMSTMAGAFLGGSELYEAVESMLSGSRYYGNDVGGISTLNDFVTSVVNSGQKLKALLDKEDSTPEDWKNFAEKQLAQVGLYLSQMTGIPIGNVNKIIAGGKNHIIDAMNGEFWSFEAGVDRSNNVNANRFFKAWSAGDAEKMQTVLDEVKASGKSEDSISSAFNSAAKDAYEAGEISLEEYAYYLEKTGMFDGEKISGKIKTILRDEFTAGSRGEDETIDALITFCGMDEDKAWETVQKWEGNAEHPDDEDYSWSKYDDLRAAIDANQDISGIVAELKAHGSKEKDIKDKAKEYIKEKYVNGEITEDKFKNWLARYCGITNREDTSEIVNDAKCKRDTGYTVEKLGEGYRAGDVGKTDAKTALTKYGGLTGTDADKKIRWWDQQKAHPDLQITEGACNNWYDGSAKTRENGHESAKAAGMSLEAYLAAKKELDKITDANGNSTGEDEYIAALAKMNLTPRQKDALYYEKYKGTTKYSTAKSW